MSVAERMKNDDKIDHIAVRTGLFTLITARLEDAHEIAVKGQSTKIDEQLVSQLSSDLESNLDEIQILLNATAVILNLRPAGS
ncbi:hypothetical protein [Parasphingorhabdus cellanae]|uniref:Uncharacterized protein n=1 Tax=Parasphingorhabdus cellanae TaxID=2806553 RepID=A0ABX7T6G3_9SPHN|nr:hypothetical protein [Parasphingorhabdus cellanae]QTD57199.1 hypothetical protein J4G78_06545 [Parasphingorhabdus cellanae]